MDPRVTALWAGFRAHTRLLVAVFDGVDEAMAAERVAGTNNMTFLGAHLVEGRAFLVRLLGGEAADPFPELSDVRRLDDAPRLPEVEAVLAAWLRLAGALELRLAEVRPDELDADAPQAFPLADGSVLGALVFLYSHEAYHLGQLGLLRRIHGLPAVRQR